MLKHSYVALVTAGKARQMQALLALPLVAALAAAEAPDLSPDTCLTLDPFDAALARTDPPPYSLKLSRAGTITNQDSIRLTLTATQPRVHFERFLLQARDHDSGVAVGMFVDTGDADIQPVNCFGGTENTAIQFDEEPKTEIRTRWMPDYDYAGNITFLWTVVQHQEVYWLRNKAESVHIYNPW